MTHESHGCGVCGGKGIILAAEMETPDDWAVCPVCEGKARWEAPAAPPADREPAAAPARSAVTRLVLQATCSGDAGVLLPLEHWQHLNDIETAIREARTWAEFARLAPEGEYKAVRRTMREYDIRVKRGDPFDTRDLPGYHDGDYPGWWDRADGRDLPEAFVRDFGRREESWVGQSWVVFPLARLEEMRTALRPLRFAIDFVTHEGPFFRGSGG